MDDRDDRQASEARDDSESRQARENRRLFGIVYFLPGTTDEQALATLDAMTRNLDLEHHQRIEFMYAAFAEQGDLPAVDGTEGTNDGRPKTEAEGNARSTHKTNT